MIVTTDANPELVEVHDRMPLLIPRDAHALWLDPRTGIDDALLLAQRTPSLEISPVGLGVNDPRNDDETLITPVAEAG